MGRERWVTIADSFFDRLIVSCGAGTRLNYALRVRVILVGLACALAGCGGSRRSPEAAVRALVDAARDEDSAEVWRLLGARTRARLTEDARRGGEQAGRRVLLAPDLLAVGWSAPGFVVLETRELARTRDSAVIEAIGRGGERERLDLVLEADGWKMELP